MVIQKIPLNRENIGVINQHAQSLSKKSEDIKLFCDPLVAIANELYFGWKAHAFKIEKENHIGYAIFNAVKDTLVSIPHSSYSHLSLDCCLNKEELSYFTATIKQNHGMNHWQIRNTTPLTRYFDNKKITHVIPITPEQTVESIIPKKLKRKINKAEKQEFQIAIGGKELLPQFHRFYSKQIRNIGSFPIPLNYLLTLSEQLQENLTVFLLSSNEKIIGSAILQHYNNLYENTLFATSPHFKNCYISDYMHSVMIDHAITHQGSYYSFGRSTKEGSVHQYKKHWNPIDIPLFWNNSSATRGGIRYLQWPKKVIPYIPQSIHQLLGNYISHIIY